MRPRGALNNCNTRHSLLHAHLESLLHQHLQLGTSSTAPSPSYSLPAGTESTSACMYTHLEPLPHQPPQVLCLALPKQARPVCPPALCKSGGGGRGFRRTRQTPPWGCPPLLPPPRQCCIMSGVAGGRGRGSGGVAGGGGGGGVEQILKAPHLYRLVLSSGALWKTPHAHMHPTCNTFFPHISHTPTTSTPSHLPSSVL